MTILPYHLLKWEYDKTGWLLKRTDPLGGVTEYAYDRGLLAAVQDPSGVETRFEFGTQGELLVLTAPGNAETRWEYDRLGRIRSVKDARGNIQRRTPDLLGRVRKVEEPDGNVREIYYDPVGNAVRVVGYKAQDAKIKKIDKVEVKRCK